MWTQPLGAQNTLPVAGGTGGQLVHACGALVATGLPVRLRFSGGPARPAPVYSTSGMRQGATVVLCLSQYFFL